MEYNLEQDMKKTAWFVDKVRATESYAQNLYAALCNNTFQKVEVMPILKDEVWSCTWRYAGGIVADMRGSGDYMDWYCSGIHGSDAPDLNFVGESHVTHEVREDLRLLGWVVLEDYYDDII